MANAFVGLEPDQVKEIIEQMNKVYPNRTVVLVKPSAVSTHAPNSRRKTHKIKIEVELSKANPRLYSLLYCISNQSF